MQVSLSCNAATAWRLPLAPAELETALGQMWQAFDPALTGLFPPEAVLELALLDEAEMARLNFECLGCVGPTNILAFPVEMPGLPAAHVAAAAPVVAAHAATAPTATTAVAAAAAPVGPVTVPSLPYLEEMAPAAGLLALSPWTLRREARLYGQDLTSYTLRLLAHGLAHLLGFDHGVAMDKAAAAAAVTAAAALAEPVEPGALAEPGEPGERAQYPEAGHV